MAEDTTTGAHCPWCGTPQRLDADGLVPPHEHPTYGDDCPGTHRRPSQPDDDTTAGTDGRGSNDDLMRILTHHGISAPDDHGEGRSVHFMPGGTIRLLDDLIAWRNAAAEELASQLRALLDEREQLLDQSRRDTRVVRSMLRLREHGDVSGVGEIAVFTLFADRIAALAAGTERTVSYRDSHDVVGELAPPEHDAVSAADWARMEFGACADCHSPMTCAEADEPRCP